MLTVDFDRLDVRPGMWALDAGCGQGRHTLEFARRGCPAVAMDLDPADLRHTRYLLAALAREMEGPAARRRGGRRGKRGGAAPDGVVPHGVVPHEVAPHLALRGDALRLPFATHRFDRVICSEVLEHVADPELATAELARVLKPGGLLAVSVPTPATEWAYRFSSDDYFNTPGGHVRIFTPRRLSALLAGHGLHVEDVNFEHAFHSLYWWVRCVFGLHDERHPAILHFRKVLTYVMFSGPLSRAERLLNYVCPKSMVLYARKAQ